jgi:hypothetical protein
MRWLLAPTLRRFVYRNLDRCMLPQLAPAERKKKVLIEDGFLVTQRDKIQTAAGTILFGAFEQMTTDLLPKIEGLLH